MTQGIAQATAAPSPTGKHAAGANSRKHDASGFGKALEPDAHRSHRKSQDKVDPGTPKPTGWTTMAEMLAKALSPAERDAFPSPEIEAHATTAAETTETAPQPRASAADRPVRHTNAASGAPEPEAKTACKSDALAPDEEADATPHAFDADSVGSVPAPPSDKDEAEPADSLAELKRALAARHRGETQDASAAAENSEEAPTAAPEKEEPKASAVEALHTRFPEPLIYFAGGTPSPRKAAAEAQDAASSEAPDRTIASRGRDTAGAVQAAVSLNAVAAAKADAATGAPAALASQAAAASPQPGPAAKASPLVPASPNGTGKASDAAVPPDETETGSVSAGEEKSPAADQPRPAPARADTAAPPAPLDGGSAATNGHRPVAAAGPAAEEPASSTAPADPRRQDQPVAAQRATVTADQTFVAPPAQPSNLTVAGLADTIAASKALEKPAPATPPEAAPDANRTRVLQIQLNPAELGSVTASLRVSGERLSVEIKVENDEAYRRLSRDGDAIVASLRSHGYDIDKVTIVQPQAAALPSARADATPQGNGATARDGGSMASGGSGTGGSGAGGQPSGRQGEGNSARGEPHAQAASYRAGSGVYI